MPKIYRNRVPESNFIMPDGRVITFHGGKFTTEDEGIQKELDAVADKPGSMIYTHTPVITPADKIPGQEVQQRAQEVMAQIAAARQATK